VKKAVHFGAGNIGRGFIGLLLGLSGYEVVFVDVNEEILAALNKNNRYKVLEVGGAEEKEYVVENVRGINGKEIAAVAKEIADGDIVTAAVGPNNLKFIAPAIAEGLKIRLEQARPEELNIIACENAVKASTELKDYIYQNLDGHLQEKADLYIGFPDSAVDRIVPPQEINESLEVKVEPFKEWIVDQTQFKGEIPEVEGMDLTDNLLAFVERKIFTLNTGHCGTAYMGYYKGYQYIHEAIKDEEIYNTIKEALLESGSSLIEFYGFDEDTHKSYINKILKRFENPALMDSVTRVGRDPLRKLGAKDRLVKPASRAVKMGKFPNNLAKCIALGFLFDVAEDEAAQKIQKIIKEEGIENALEEVTGISPKDKLGQEVLKEYKKLAI
jgi:mannitol-1-phosphate 5-dehydrogenase